MKKIVDLLKETELPKPIKISGWVRSRRDYKKVSFVEIYDGSTINHLQLIFSKDFDLKDVTTGASIFIEGELVKSIGTEQPVEVQVTILKIIGKADPETYPMQKKEHTMEFFREKAHLRSRTKLFQSVFRIRHGLSMAIHKFFDEKGFIYYHTPILTSSDCEGAGQVFKLKDEEFFGKSAHLTVSGQLEGELGALSLGKIYTFSPTFRAEESYTTKHLSEFWMIEPEMSFYQMDDAIELAEELLKFSIDYTIDKYSDELKYLSEEDIDRIKYLKSISSQPFQKITYKEAIEILNKSWGEDIDTESEKFLISKFEKPVIVTDYPTELKSFYMKRSSDGKTVKGFDILFPVVGEMIGGSEREDELEALTERITEIGITDLDWYLDTRRFGSVPHSGFGLGFERLVMFVTGMKNIRDVIPFPRSPKSISF